MDEQDEKYKVMLEEASMRLKTENVALKEKLSEMNRRCQRAESAALVKVEDCKRQGISLGRGLANWHGSKLQRDLDAALLQNSELRAQYEELGKANEGVLTELGKTQRLIDEMHPVVEAAIAFEVTQESCADLLAAVNVYTERRKDNHCSCSTPTISSDVRTCCKCGGKIKV